MILNTLGPRTTDCVKAIRYVRSKFDAVKLYSSFDRIIANISNLRGQYILMPVAFESCFSDYGWKDFNFEYHRLLRIVEVFHSFTQTMVLVENKKYVKNKAVIHPATKFFMTEYLDRKRMDIPIDFAPSKVVAKMLWEKEAYRFTIVSQALLDDNLGIKVRETFSPEMIWCLYEVKG
ncbi:hypothetical protein D3H64_01635 [Atopobacter sp. AH10]|uniref:hypothetical protein n=1 Tax=Atopobacter sp. AH10 TaxID=2315861 RepID=UPI000EF1C934|nr:hypothetical protein [Atopobacter sp. AH10]RLK63979.1 hypothetical protein D3H64_01635 [Atopobacter sp. AH10]